MKKVQNKFPASGFRRKLLSWYDVNCRDLPWRRDTDPYRIWLSEIMLQQTRVDTVIPYYHRFLSAYPTLASLAEAKQDDVLKLWEGLGYYSRARNFLQAVQEVSACYGGEVPRDPETFGMLCGVGDYTCAAVSSIAFNQPLAVVDGNVRRVFCRLFSIADDSKKSAVQKEINCLAEVLLDCERPGDYNQAVMELGALICTPRNPCCDVCPVAEYCRAREQGNAELLPVKSKKKTLPVKTMAAVVMWTDGLVLVRRRTDETLLKGLWEFPNVEWDGVPASLPGLFTGLLGKHVQIGAELMQLTHTFSHMRWKVTVFQATVIEWFSVEPPWRWVEPEQLKKLAFPAVYHPVIRKIEEK
jgi:A/G-specific adenine glycosylase